MAKSFVRTASVIAAFAVLATSTPVSAQQVVNYGTQPATHPLYIAKALGLFAEIEKKHNIRIQLRVFPAGPPENAAMAAGELQIASAGMGPAIIAAARLPATLIGITILDQTAILVPKDSTARSMQDLRGKRVAFPGEGTQQYPLLLKALADAGMKHTDIQLFKTDGSQIPTLLQQKSVDAGITWDPHISNALAAGHSRVLLKSDKIMPIKAGHYVGNGEYVHNDFMAKHPAIVQDLMNANVRAIDFILKDPQASAKMWSKEMGFPENVITYSIRERISVFNRDIVPDKATVDAYVAFLKQAGILEAKDNAKVNTSFAEKALASTK
jgi:aliphatic sulfonates family ABC transporter substrate-binding protein